MRCVIIDYGSGNLRSAAKACERAVADHRIAGDVMVSSDPADLKQATHIILPGVGAFADCMQGLKARAGLLDALEHEVHVNKKNFLGICVGMQLLFERGYEHGEHTGLGWLKGEVVKLTPNDANLKIPHMGWNQLQFAKNKSESNKDPYAYFVHSYHAKCTDREDILATTDYGGEVVAIVNRGNIYGTQFHPEKSQETGLKLLADFLRL